MYDYYIKYSSGIFLADIKQIIKSYESIIFESSINIYNIEFSDDSDYITILSSGTYIINLSAQFTTECNLTLFVNESPDLFTRIYSNSGIINIHELLKLNKNDKISIRNTSSYPIETKKVIIN